MRKLDCAFQFARDDADDAVFDAGVNDFIGIDQEKPIAAFDHQLALLGHGALLHHLHQAVELLAGGVGSLEQAAHPQDGFFQPRLGDRLQEVVDGIHFEGLHGVLVISRGKNEERQARFLLQQALDHAKAVDAGHLHIQEHQMRIQFAHHAHGFNTVLSLADHFDVGKTLQQECQLVASRLFIIHNQRRDFHTAMNPFCGLRRGPALRATVSSPSYYS